MTDTAYIIRELRRGDEQDIIALWQSVFGDDERYIRDFLELLPRTGKGAVAEKDGHIAAMAYALSGISYLGRSCGYIYAVATLPEHRGSGLGEAVSVKAAELSQADIICTMPAEDSLYRWYEKILGLDSALHVSETELSPAPAKALRRIDAEEYHALREEHLKDTPHAVFALSHIELLEKLCSCYGGGLFRLGDSIAAAEYDGHICRVVDAAGADTEAAASAVGAQLGAEKILLRRSAAEGERGISFPAGAFSPETVWSLVFD